MNKKKIFGSIAVLAIAAIAAFNVNVNTQENGLSDVSLNNIEALAQESGAMDGFNSRCRFDPFYDCYVMFYLGGVRHYCAYMHG